MPDPARGVRGSRSPAPFLVVAALILSASPATGAALTWSDVVSIADGHPAVAAGRRDVSTATWAVTAADAAPNPTLGAGLGQGIARFGDDTRFEWGVSLEIPLDWLLRRGYDRDVAQAGVAVARAELLSLRLEVLDRLRALFWELAGAQVAAADLASLEDGAAALVDAVTLRVEHGEARPVERVRAEVELETVRAERARSEGQLSAARAALAHWLGLDGADDLAVAVDVTALPALPDRDALLALASRRHPALLRAEATVGAADAAVAQERSRRIPAFGVAPFYESELDRDAWGVELAVELPLFNWNDAGIARAEEERAAASDRRAAAERAVRSTLAEEWGRCAARRETAARYAERVLPRTREATAAEEERYRVGEADLLDAIDARRTLLEARRQWRGALLDAWLDCSHLALLQSELTRPAADGPSDAGSGETP